MTDRAVGDLVKGQLFLFGGLGLCVLVLPAGLSANSGISYYGVHWASSAPYAAGLAGAAWFTRSGLRTAAANTPAPRFVAWAADLFALLLAGVVVTPYTVNSAVDWIHRLLGASLFVLQLVLAGHLVAAVGRDLTSLLLLTVQFGGGVASAIYLLPATGYLFQAQLVFQLGFGLLVIREVARLRRAAPSGLQQAAHPTAGHGEPEPGEDDQVTDMPEQAH